MRHHKPISELPTHEVVNVPPHIGNQDLWASDSALREAVVREGADWAKDKLAALGASIATEENYHKAEQANRHTPELRAFDRHGRRINQVEFHPAYHDLMDLAVSNGVSNLAWNREGVGAQVAHTAQSYMFNQVESGVMCPMVMTYSAIPTLRLTPEVGDEWIPRLLSTTYDPRDIPASEKTGATMGMFMTEKQGGSDVRANSTRAEPLDGRTGSGAPYLLTGHKFFCSAPMCDAFLVLAYTEVGLSCFLVPRWRPEGERNNLFIQRLKDKLGNRSNASSEMEFHDTYGVMVGEEGRGVRAIMEMVTGNRICCAIGSASLMRQALVQALHHCRHRSAFQKRLVQQPLMQNVLADLAIEAEASLVLSLRVARAMDEAAEDPMAATFARLGTAVAKYWNCKRAPEHVYEASECLGGPGYVEDSMMPRLYREAPVNSIWEGSGNVVCLDVLRTLSREPEAVPALLAELEQAKGGHALLDEAMGRLQRELENHDALEARARWITELMALTLQGAILVRHAPNAVSDAFCQSRLAPRWCGTYGTLPAGTAFDEIIERAAPEDQALAA